MPSPIQIALAFEAFANTPGIIALLAFPSQTLKPFLASEISSVDLSETALLLARCVGVFILTLTPQLFLAYPNTPDCVGKRKLVYHTLGVGEAALFPLFMFEALRASDGSKSVGLLAGGFSRKAALMYAATMILVLAWRVFVFAWRPQWFEGKEEQMKERRGKKE
ncbi:hypothetical protein MMC21_000496 [Puttea exsequens]|nr:hypothetical protein [Puttea exsequens]